MTQVTTKETKTKKQFNFPFVFFEKLTRTLVSIFFVASFFLIVLYSMGNFQHFTDRSQLLILTVLSILSVILAIFSILGILEDLVFIVLKEKKVYSAFTIMYFVFSLLFAIFLIAYSVIVKRLSAGIF